MFNFLKKFDPIVHLFFLVAIIILFSLAIFMRGQITALNLRLAGGRQSPTVVRVSPEETAEPSVEISQQDILKTVSDIIATISATPQTIIERQVVIKTGGQTSFIGLGSTATTTSTDWDEVKDAQVYIDLEKDYGKDANVSWEASLKVAHGNGQVFARLYDDTNKIVVLGSELSTTNNVDFKQVSSGKLNLWAGRNLYKVQLKSLNSFEITYSGGRIKVSY